jgi:PPK2 family polyphosphate:nucleotide phosphotransferase
VARSQHSKVVADLIVTPGEPARLAKRSPASHLGLTDKGDGRTRVAALQLRLDDLHNRLWAEATRSVILVLQGMDAAGKDGTIRRVITGLNPQGCTVTNFKVPTDVDLAHDYLWRVHNAMPARGLLGVFNRSHYEDVVAARIGGVVDKKRCDLRYHHIREFERMLAEEGTTMVKVFLHISNEEQRARLQARIDDPDKNWKFHRADLEVRAKWDEYQDCYEEAITATSTDWAPWYVVPADHKWVRDVAVAEALLGVFELLDPRIPDPEPGLEGVVVE